MKKLMIRDIALLGLATAFMAPVLSRAADLNPLAGPMPAGSDMYSTEMVWYRLHGGAEAAKLIGIALVEPNSGPDMEGNEGMALDEIMAEAPVADNVNGATQADVVAGKTYWSLRTGTGIGTDSSWGLQAGRRAPASVANSGQTGCYEVDGTPIVDCVGAMGQDGALQKGEALPTPRFTDNGNGTVTDNLTGLIWLQDANCFGTRAWDVALNDAATLNSGECGLSLSEGSVEGDWRLPNQKELSSLVNLKYYDPALSNTEGNGNWSEAEGPFIGVQSNYYWSSSTVIFFPSGAWNVNLKSGIVDGDDKANPHAVWPVRDGL